MVVKDIVWDTDDISIDDLPEMVMIDDDISEEEIADHLSDVFGWCVKSFKIVHKGVIAMKKPIIMGTVEMRMEKATKNTVKFEEILKDDLASPKIGVLYVPKTTLSEIGWKKEKTLLVDLSVPMDYNDLL